MTLHLSDSSLDPDFTVAMKIFSSSLSDFPVFSNGPGDAILLIDAKVYVVACITVWAMLFIIYDQYMFRYLNTMTNVSSYLTSLRHP